MWRLVVCGVLPCYAHTVGMVVHQGRHAVDGRDVGCEDIYRAAVGRVPEEYFLAPVTEEVGLQIRGFLGAIACR